MGVRGHGGLVIIGLFQVLGDGVPFVRKTYMHVAGFVRTYLTHSVFNVVLQKSISAQIRQLILYISNIEGYVDGSVRELASAKRL